MAVDQARAARLKEAREIHAGIESAAEAWRRFQWEGITSATSYQQMENGTRGCLKHVLKFSRSFRVRMDWLAHGIGTPKETRRQLAASGIVGLFGIISDKKTDKMQDVSLGLVEPPPIEGEFSVYLVEGDFNYPALWNGDVIYAGPAVAPDTVLGKQCVAKLADGTRRICLLGQGTAAGLYLLVSINATPVPDAAVVEAAPIIWIKRG